MSLKIRLARGGAKKRPFYSIVVADSRSPRDGRFIEKLGTYNPMLDRGHADRITLKEERIKHWLGGGGGGGGQVKALTRHSRGRRGLRAARRRERRTAVFVAPCRYRKGRGDRPSVRDRRPQPGRSGAWFASLFAARGIAADRGRRIL